MGLIPNKGGVNTMDLIQSAHSSHGAINMFYGMFMTPSARAKHQYYDQIGLDS